MQTARAWGWSSAFAVFAALASTGCSSSSSGPPDAAMEAAPPEDHAPPEEHYVPPVDSGPDTIADAGCALESGAIVIKGGPCSVYPPSAKECTSYSGVAATFEIYDDRDASVDLVSISESCAASPFSTITPAVPESVCTYVSSAWQVDDSTTKMPIGSFILQANQSYSVTVH